MKKQLLGFIDSRPLIWFHYVLIVGVIFLAHWLSDIFGIEGLVMNQETQTIGWIALFVWYLIFIILGDNLIHKVLKVD